jgi:hypothetical protein
MGSTQTKDHEEYEERRVPPKAWEKAPDAIHHTAHYTYGPMECIEAMLLLYGVEKVIAYCELAAFKYRYRAGYKDDIVKDIQKALWYEGKAKELQEGINKAESGAYQ